MSEDVSQRRIDRAALEIAATPEELYAAFADPAKLMEWLPPGSMTGCALEHDFREGGRYRIALTYDETAPASVGKTEGRTDVSTGRFLSLEPGRENPGRLLRGRRALTREGRRCRWLWDGARIS